MKEEHGINSVEKFDTKELKINVADILSKKDLKPHEKIVLALIDMYKGKHDGCIISNSEIGRICGHKTLQQTASFLAVMEQKGYIARINIGEEGGHIIRKLVRLK
jgi:hypothetical protein